MVDPCTPQHHAMHAFASMNARRREGVALVSRRGMLKASVAGIGGLTLPRLLQSRAEGAIGPASRGSRRKSVILLWMAGGPSHIDMWDPKPERPLENRGPFGVIQTKLPGVFFSEYLPKQAAMLDKMTVIRSVDARRSNHEPNKVFQTANLAAEGRTNPKAERYPAIASIVAKHHGANHPSMPPYVAFMKSRSHVAFAGALGKRYEPFLASQAAKLPVYDLVGNDTGETSGAALFDLPLELNLDRIGERRRLLDHFDKLRRGLDQDGSMDAMDHYSHQAIDMVAGSRAREAFDITREPEAVRQRYGNHLWCQQALLARRLVAAGVSFVTLDLSYHTASGTWDTHGDNIPPYGGIWNGLRPLLPLFDHLYTTLINDLEEHGLLDETLVIAMGEFGRTPQVGTQGSTDGRNHWLNVMSMTMAGGGLKHGQVIGSSESDGGNIRERPVSPGDIAATIYHHMGVPLNTTYLDDQQRPQFIVDHGAVMRELI